MHLRRAQTPALRGFTLIETIVAVVLLGLFAVGIGAFLRQQSTRGTEVLSRQTALNLAQSQLERIRAVGPLAYNYGVDLSGPLQADTTAGQDIREVFFRDRFFMDGEGLQRGDEATPLLPYEVVIEGRVQCVGGPLTEETPVSLFAWRTFDRATNSLRSCAEMANPQKPVVTYRVMVGAGETTPAMGSSALPAMEVGLQFTERDLLGALCFGGQIWDPGTGACGCPAGQSFNGGRCSCSSGLVWNGSACVTSTCVVSPPRAVIQQPLSHPSVVAADPALQVGAHFYQEMRPDWCAGGETAPTEAAWGRFSGGTFVPGGLVPAALNFPARTLPDRAHVNPSGPFSHWNYACAFGTDFDAVHGLCGCSAATQVTPPGASMTLARQATGGWVSTGAGSTTVACPGPSANAGADPSDGTRTRTLSYSQTCVATGTPGVYTDQGLQTSSTDGPCGCNAALGLADSGFGTCACTGGASWNEMAGRCGCAAGDPSESQPCTGGREGDMSRFRTCQANGSWGPWGAWDESGCACPSGLDWDGSSCGCGGPSTETESATCSSGVGQQTRERSRVCSPSGWGAWSGWSGWDTSSCGCPSGTVWDGSDCVTPPPTSCSGPSSETNSGVSLPGGAGATCDATRTRSCVAGVWSAWSAPSFDTCTCPAGQEFNGTQCVVVSCSGDATETTACPAGQTGTGVRSRTCTGSTWSAWSAWDFGACACPAGMSAVGGTCQCDGPSADFDSRPCAAGDGFETRSRSRVCTASGWSDWGTWSSWDATGCVLTPPTCVVGATVSTPESRACPSGSVEATEDRMGTSTCVATASGPAWSDVVFGPWSGCTVAPPTCQTAPGYTEACAINTCYVSGPTPTITGINIVCDPVGCSSSITYEDTWTRSRARSWYDGPWPTGPWTYGFDFTEFTTSTSALTCS